MNPDLRDLLDDLATASLTPGDPGAALRARATARARRTARRISLAAGALVLVVLSALLLPAATTVGAPTGFARPSAAAVAGHPVEVGRQWPVLDLPGTPGPLAALLQRAGGSWEAVAPDGHRWSVPLDAATATGQAWPSLSPDGRILAVPVEVSAREGRGRYELHDLLTGALVRSDVVDTRSESGRWSPDGRAFLPALQVIDTATGTVRPLPAPVAIVAGLLDSDRVVTLQVDRPGGTAASVVAVTTDLRTGGTASVTLGAPVPGLERYEPSRGFVLDDATVAVTFVDPGAGPTRQPRLERYQLLSGARLLIGNPVPGTLALGEDFRCATPVPGDVVVPVSASRSRQLFGTMALTNFSPVEVDSALGPQCLLWAADAVTGPVVRGQVLGTPGSWAVLAATLLVLLVALVGLRRRLPGVVAVFLLAAGLACAEAAVRGADVPGGVPNPWCAGALRSAFTVENVGRQVDCAAVAQTMLRVPLLQGSVGAVLLLGAGAVVVLRRRSPA